MRLIIEDEILIITDGWREPKTNISNIHHYLDVPSDEICYVSSLRFILLI